MNPRSIAPCLAALLLTVTASAQPLARAMLLEETHPDPRKALASYERALAEGSSGEDRFLARLGKARTLRKLHRLAESSALLEALASEVAGHPRHAAALTREQERLRQEKQETDPEVILRRVRNALFSGELAEVIAYGEAAVPAVASIIRQPSPNDLMNGSLSNAYRVLPRLTAKDIQKKTVEVLAATKPPHPNVGQDNRSLTIRSMIALVNEEKRDWVATLQELLGLPDPRLRRAVAEDLSRLHRPAWALWQKALADREPEVRAAAFDALRNSQGGVTNAQWFGAFDRAIKDESVRLRRKAVASLRQAKARDWKRTLALVDRLLADPDHEVREATLSQLQILPLNEQKTRARRHVNDPWAGARELCAQILGREAVTSDAPLVRGLMLDSAPRTRNAAARAAHAFSASAMCDAPESEADLVRCLGQRTTEQVAVSLLARAGSRAVSEQVVPYLHHGDGRVVVAALYYVVRHDLTGAFPAVLDVLPTLRHNHLPHTDRTFEPAFPTEGPRMIFDWLKRKRHGKLLLQLVSRIDSLPYGQSELSGTVVAVLSKDDIPALLEAAKAISAQRKAELLTTLTGWMGPAPAAIRTYVELLQSTEEALRQTAVNALRMHGSPSNVPDLLAILGTNASASLAALVGRAIAAHATPAHVRPLAEALRNSKTLPTRRAVLSAIRAIGTPEATALLVDELRRPGRSRRHVLTWLGEKKIKDAFPIIIDMVKGDSLTDPEERKAAIRALGAYGDPAVVPHLLAAVSRWKDTARNPRFGLDGLKGSRPSKPSIYVGFAAIYDLGPETFLDVADQVLSGNDVALMRSVLRLLAFVDDPRADALILGGLSHPDATIRTRAASAAGHALLTAGTPALRKLLRDSDVYVRRSATNALRRFVEFGITLN